MNRRAVLAALACSFPSASAAQTPAPPTTRRFGDAAAYSAARDGAAFVLARHGVVLGEDYPGGPPDARWSLGAATRAFAPVLAASLVSDGLMNFDEPVALTLGEWGADPAKSMLSLRLLLNGTSGISFPRGATNDLATALTLAPAQPPGVRYDDDAAIYVLFCEIVRRKLSASGREADPAAYLCDRTLTPIGCAPVGWIQGGDGVSRLDAGAAVSARGWASMGELIRRDGVWRAEQLVDDDALRQAMTSSVAQAGAGIGFYLAGADARDPPLSSDLWRMNPPAPRDLAMAAGEGGQRLYIIPSAGLVVARLARSLSSRDWSDAAFLALVLRDL